MRSLRSWRASRAAIFGAAGSFVLLALVMLGLFALSERRTAQRMAEQHGRELALVLEGQSDRLLDAADSILRQAIEVAGPLDWPALEGTPEAHLKLKQVVTALPYVLSVWVGDETGLARVSSISYPSPQASAADREYFTALRTPGAGFHLSERLTSRVDGRDFVNASRGIYDAAGRLTGFVTASLDPVYLEAAFRRIDGLFPLSVTLLRASDLKLLATTETDAEATARAVAGLNLPGRLGAGGSVAWMGSFGQTGEAVVTARRSGSYPLILLIAVDAATMRRMWLADLGAPGTVTVVAILFVLGMAWMALQRLGGQQRAEAAQAESERRYAAFVAHTPDPVLELRAGGDAMLVEQANPAFARFVETPLPDLVGRPVPEALRGALLPAARECLASGSPRGIRAELAVGGKARHCEFTLVPVGAPPEGLVAIGRDVTDRVLAEAALRQSQKMEAIGQITGGVAHDFNNLLMVVGANIERARRRAEDPLVQRMALEQAELAVDRGATLTRQLLAFARRQPLEPKVIDVNRLVRDTAELLRRTLGEATELELVSGGGLWNALADATQLQTVLLNLAFNGRDAMPSGGKLTIETANAYLDEDYAARHSEVQPGAYVMIAVSDTGSGIAPEILDRIFDPFFTTKEEGRGTGLGLSQVYGFVKQSGGHVKVYSERGHGTVVRLYLPRTGEVEAATLEIPDSQAMPGGHRVLLVEDEPEVRRAVTAMLEELGCTVFTAGSGPEALQFLETAGPLDLLFTDVVLPGGMTGRQLADRVAELRPDLPVLFTSGYTENAIIHHGRLDEGVHLLSKPFTHAQLVAKLKLVLPALAAE